MSVDPHRIVITWEYLGITYKESGGWYQEPRLFEKIISCQCLSLVKPSLGVGPTEILRVEECEIENHGWLKTNDPYYCPPDKSAVYICPTCAAEKKRRDEKKWK
jgi:hypothetical protein